MIKHHFDCCSCKSCRHVSILFVPMYPMYQSDTKQSSVGLEAILITLLVSAAGKSLKKYAKFNQFFPETALKSPVNTYTKKVVY